MIDLNPERDKWTTRYLERTVSWTRIINVLSRKAALPPPEDQAGTFACPYCYLDTPHSPGSHDEIAEAIEQALRDGIVLQTESSRNVLTQIAKQCRAHGQISLEGEK